ncbi:MAG: hypothetical protein JWR02_1860 [Mucilaginibacter sp.]|nr:hypothetical protein [Mucilaginibacter sp.]
MQIIFYLFKKTYGKIECYRGISNFGYSSELWDASSGSVIIRNILAVCTVLCIKALNPKSNIRNGVAFLNAFEKQINREKFEIKTTSAAPGTSNHWPGQPGLVCSWLAGVPVKRLY